jgi:hypothetical protein
MRHKRGAVKKFSEFFDVDGFVHHEFISPEQSVTGHFYVDVLQRLLDAVRRKACDKWQAGTVAAATR